LISFPSAGTAAEKIGCQATRVLLLPLLISHLFHNTRLYHLYNSVIDSEPAALDSLYEMKGGHSQRRRFSLVIISFHFSFEIQNYEIKLEMEFFLFVPAFEISKRCAWCSRQPARRSRWAAMASNPIATTSSSSSRLTVRRRRWKKRPVDAGRRPIGKADGAVPFPPSRPCPAAAAAQQSSQHPAGI
jgi:hypothetical protein